MDLRATNPPLEKYCSLSGLGTGTSSVAPHASELKEPVWDPLPEQKRILVTGGTGLLGRPIVEELSHRGFAVATISTNTFDRMHVKVQRKFAENNVCSMCLDLAADVKDNDGEQLREIIATDRYDLLINLAADRGGVKWDGTHRKMNYATLNVDLPAKLAKISQDTGLAVFHISTEYVFSGNSNSETGYPALPVSEEDPRFVDRKRGTPYALQKFEAEEHVKGRDRITVIRLPVLYGEMNNALEDGTASASINDFLGDNTFLYDTWQRRYPTCAEDAAYVISSLACKWFQSGLSRRIYHYGAQKCVSKYDFVLLFASTVGILGNQVNQLDVRSEDVSKARPQEKWPPYDVRLDNSDTRSELGGLWREPSCIKCYENVFANTCDECNRLIGIDSKDLSYKDKHWHEACFLCNKCRMSLVDKQFGSKAENIYCGPCYDAQFATRCDGCGEIFRAGTKKMEYKTRQWHEKCFACCVCQTPIGTKSFIPREQEIYCTGCYEEKFATRCIKCDKIITTGGVTYKQQPWHRECFTCTNCNTSLAGQRFTSRDEKPYCADCFGELFAKRCTACTRPITGIGGTRFISFEDRHWHNDCFICATCSNSLVGKGFITDGSDILCPDCAKQRLM